MFWESRQNLYQYKGSSSLKPLKPLLVFSALLPLLCLVSPSVSASDREELSVQNAEPAGQIAMSGGLLAEKQTAESKSALSMSNKPRQNGKAATPGFKPLPGTKVQSMHDAAPLSQVETGSKAQPAATQTATTAQDSTPQPDTKSTQPMGAHVSVNVSITEPGKGKQAGSSSTTAGAEPMKRPKSQFLDVLPCLTWLDPDQDQKAVLLCVHGLGLNNSSYKDFGVRMAQLGYLVYAVDVPGFGSFQTADQQRDRVDFVYCMNGIANTLALIHKVNRKLPVYMLGESMGGAIALRVTSEHPELVDGLVSSVPSGDRFKQGKETLRVGLKLLTAPNKEFDIGTEVIKRATEDESGAVNDKLRKSWTEDPLNRMNLTPKELLRFQGFMNDNHDNARKITKTPVLFVQGCKDRLVRPEGTQELFNAIGSEDRQIELIHDKGHLIFEEGQFDDQVIAKVDKWLTTHIESTKLTKK